MQQVHTQEKEGRLGMLCYVMFSQVYVYVMWHAIIFDKIFLKKNPP